MPPRRTPTMQEELADYTGPMVQQVDDSELGEMVYTHLHRSMPLVMPFGISPIKTFRLWNENFERWLVDAYAPSIPSRWTDDAALTFFLDPNIADSAAFVRRQIISHASRIVTGIALDGRLERWRALPQDRREELILQRFEAEALDAVRNKHPYGRQHTPELTLANLLRDNGEGFAELAQAVVWPAGTSERENAAGRIHVLPHAQWERLIGMKDGMVQSRARRAFIEFHLINRHIALVRLVERVLNELARPEDRTPNPEALIPGQTLPPRCALCFREVTSDKCCARCKAVKRYVYYCSREYQKDHWKAGHKPTCGKPLDNLGASASFPTTASAPPPALAKIRNLLMLNPNALWIATVLSPGQPPKQQGMGIPGTAFSPSDYAAILAEGRKIALGVCDAPDDLGIGIVALWVKGGAGLHRVDGEGMLLGVAETFRLGEGEKGCEAVEKRMELAREELERGKYPQIKRLVEWYESDAALRLSYFLSPPTAPPPAAAKPAEPDTVDKLAADLSRLPVEEID